MSVTVKDGDAITYHGLWGTGPWIRGRGTANLLGGRQSPPGPIGGYGPVLWWRSLLCMHGHWSQTNFANDVSLANRNTERRVFP